MRLSSLFKRGGAACLALVLALSVSVCPAAASDALGSDRRGRTVQLAAGTALTDNSLWSATYSDLRTEFYVTYQPNATVLPVLWYGSNVTEKAALSTAAKQLGDRGYRVLAGINAGFFNGDGTPVGMLLSDGVLRSLDRWNNQMVGFLPDGTAFVDDGDVTKSVRWTDPLEQSVSMPLAAFNGSRDNNGVYLYNDDFGRATGNTLTGVDVVLEPLTPGERPTMSCSMTLQVVRVTDSTVEGVPADNAIPAGSYVLSANKNCSDAILAPLRALLPGSQVTVEISGSDPRWAQAVCGVSGLHSLVKDGAVNPDLENGANPRSALGIRADGSTVLYAIDGRRSGYSVGASVSQVAQRLVELGCVRAVELDGGGSTTFGASLPGVGSFSVLNKPSGGSQRAVCSSLFLVTRAPAAGVANRFHVGVKQDVVLTGASTPVAAVPADENGYAAPSPGIAGWNSDGGTVGLDPAGNTVFTAGERAGSFTVTAICGPVQGSAPVRVVDTLSRLTITRQDTGKAVSSLKLEPGGSVELDAAGTWFNLPVAMDDSNVIWQTEGEIGAVDAAGHFTAGEKNAAGSILAVAGGQQVTIPVTVDNGDPFTDISDHWSREYVKTIYDMGLTTGIPQPDGTYQYQPEGELSRGEVLTFLSRLLRVDTAAYEDVKLPFDDVSDIPDWALPHVKALYALQVFRGISAGGKLSAGMGDPLSREMVISMLGRLLARQQDGDLSVFTDGDQVSDWAAPYVKTLLAEGVLSGGSSLGPQVTMRRGELAMLLVKVSELPMITG